MDDLLGSADDLIDFRNVLLVCAVAIELRQTGDIERKVGTRDEYSLREVAKSIFKFISIEIGL